MYSMSPRRKWDLPPPLPQASVPLPLPVRGWGSPNSNDWRKSLTLCLLCGWNPKQPFKITLFYRTPLKTIFKRNYVFMPTFASFFYSFSSLAAPPTFAITLISNDTSLISLSEVVVLTFASVFVPNFRQYCMPTHGPEKVESIRTSVDWPFSL